MFFYQIIINILLYSLSIFIFSQNTPLCKAIENGNIEIVKLLLSFKNIDINYEIILK